MSLYVSWQADDPSSAELYYHRDDFDGVIRISYIIYGSSDDRYAIAQATEREKAAAETTAMLIKDEHITRVDASTVKFEDDPD